MGIKGSAFQSPVMQRRKLLGQFATPLPLCDLMLDSVIRTPGDRVLDPATGDGRFLRQARKRGHNPSCLFGVEVAPNDRLLDMEAEIHEGSFLGDLPWDDNSFDVIVGNPPYVRHELLGGELKGELAALKKADSSLRALPETLDLYLWFFIRAWALLKPGGRLCFVTSNSWLFTQNGQSFCNWLARHYKIGAVIESDIERWFEDAAIHGVVTILEKRENPLRDAEEDNEHPIQVIRLGRGVNDIASLMASDNAHWITQAELVQGKPSLALRTPAFLKDLPENTWVSLETLGRVRYPVKTGINDFFYLTAETAKKFGIEPEFLKPVVKSAKNVLNYTIAEENCPYFLFSCEKTPEELKKNKKRGALSYIAWGEQQVASPRQKRSEATEWPLVASVRSRPHWYQVPGISAPDILCNRFTNRRFFFAGCESNLIEDQTFYGLLLHEKHDKSFIAALLNSSLVYLMMELSGQTNLGEGVLQCSRQDMASLKVPDPRLYPPALRKEIENCWEPMRTRTILPIEVEVLATDRQQLDAMVLRVFNDAKLLQQKIYDTLIARVNTRLHMSRTIMRSF